MPINTGGKGQAALMMTRPGCRRISWLWKMGQVGPGVVRGGVLFSPACSAGHGPTKSHTATLGLEKKRPYQL